jgi:hypothetical protein
MMKTKLPKVLSFKRTPKPFFGVTIYGTVQSRSRGTRLNHQVVKMDGNWKCTCEHNLFRSLRCDHIKAMAKKAAQRRAA